MTPFDLLFLASLLFVFLCLVTILASALRSRPSSLRLWLKILTAYLVLYAVVLVSTSLLRPRRIYAPGQRRCWDDWCAAALRATAAATAAAPSCPSIPGTRVWLAEIEVSSVAKRVRQRAPDARAELEDAQGTSYQPCSASIQQSGALVHSLSDFLGPGDSFRVLLPFQLAANQAPAGLVFYHGQFPGNLIIADDAAILHRPALHQLTISPQN